MEKLPTVTVDCARWARGGRNGLPALKNADGNLCCLGFATEQLTGVALVVPPGLNAHLAAPRNFTDKTGIPVPGLTEGLECLIADNMAHINDDKSISDDERIERLRPLAKKAGFTLDFINKDKL